MTHLTIDGDTLTVRFSRWERALGLIRDQSFPLSAVTRCRVAHDGLAAARGLRAPGLGVPGVRKVGTWRGRGRALVSVRRHQPAVVIDLAGQRFRRLVLGSDDAAALAARLGGRADEHDVIVPGPAGPLAATLALPPDRGPGPVPGVVLVSGSGPIDRDSNHPRLRIDVARELAAALREAGIASLRYDKRGVGTTDVDWRTVGLGDNVDDLTAAVAALRSRPEVDDAAVMVIGHSEGAILAGMVAAAGVPLAGIGLLCGAARPGRDLLLWQAAATRGSLPAPVRGLLRLLRVDLVGVVAKNHERLLRTTSDVARVGGVRTNAKWMREFLLHDPRADLRGLRLPVLAVTGSKDLQTPPEDAEEIARLVGGAGEAHVVPDVTHMVRRQDGPPSLRRYREEVRHPLDPRVVALVVDWASRTAAGATAPS